MRVCDSPTRNAPGLFGWLGMVLVLAVPPAVWGGEPFEPAPSETIWTDDFPPVETRIYWHWPEFLTISWPRGLEEADVSPLPENKPIGELFGRIDWLSPKNVADPGLGSADGLIFRGETPGWRFPLFSESQDYEITLVRGGLPRLFGARARGRIEYGDEFDDVKRVRGQVLVNLIANRLGLDASVDSWEDHRPTPKSLGDFWTGDANLVYSLGAQRVAMRGGVGASWVYDRDLDVGYNFTYGADLYLTRPWLVSGEIDWGRINNIKLLHWRATAGIQLLMAEVYIGYDSFKWDNIRFDGPVAGVGIWF